MKQQLTFSKAEGNPVLLGVCQSYLVIGTDTAHIRVFDLSRRYRMLMRIKEVHVLYVSVHRLLLGSMPIRLSVFIEMPKLSAVQRTWRTRLLIWEL